MKITITFDTDKYYFPITEIDRVLEQIDELKTIVIKRKLELEKLSRDEESGKIDMDIPTLHMNPESRELLQIRDMINELEQEDGNLIIIEKLIEKADKQEISKERVIECIDKLKRSGDIFEQKKGYLKKL